MSAELFYVAPDELVAGDRVLVGAFLRTVISTQPDLDRPGILLVNHDGGTYSVCFETDVQIAPNASLGECDELPVVDADDDGALISHVRSV
jgi:hypothetical protein